MTRFPRTLLLALMLAASLPAHAAGPTGLLNDTGQTLCDDGANNLVVCSAANSNDAATYPRQDGRFGRDPAAAASALTKTGAGTAGFDYTKVCFNGDLAGSGTCTGALVANTTATATGTPTTDWACTKDNVTNLIWSLESGYGDWTTYANTTFPGTTNTATRCGYNTGWRLPTRRELLSIVNNGAVSPAIDSAYFPGTVSDWYWSADTYAPNPAFAWFVYFVDGYPYAYYESYYYYVRLVRSGQ
jgi:hypothetical protein